MLVCVLCYGSHLNVIRRCISSIRRYADYPGVSELRIGMNAVTQDVREFIADEVQGLKIPALLFSEANNENVGKYPLMRQMFRHASPQDKNVMWFDDDSFIKPIAPSNFWEIISTYLNDAEQVGSIYRLQGKWNGNQRTVISKQPWYTAKKWSDSYRVRFVTGGWWAARLAVLLKHDYPFKTMYHNGGDAILGELIYQQDYRIMHHNQFVGINADELQNESKAPRRGLSTKPLWHDGEADPRPSFNFIVETHNNGITKVDICESV